MQQMSLCPLFLNGWDGMGWDGRIDYITCRGGSKGEPSESLIHNTTRRFGLFVGCPCSIIVVRYNDKRAVFIRQSLESNPFLALWSGLGIRGRDPSLHLWYILSG